MIPFQALSRVLAVQPVLDAIERDQAAPRAAFEQLRIGQTISGVVKSQTKGLSLVEIEGQPVAMRLPPNVVTGDTLKLRFGGNMPQPVFLLEPAEVTAEDAPQLSQTARMLSDIMQRVPERALPTLTPPAPLLAQPSPQPAEIALALRTALVRSGLFYESHLANWVAGQDTLDGLMTEPQNRLADAMARFADAAGRPAAEHARAATPLALPDLAGGTDARQTNPLHTLLTQQLQVLESPHFAWRGELWPGQPLQWEIRREDEHAGSDANSGAAGGDEAPTSWESHLKLTLPTLGVVDVHIRLDADKAFSIRMTPEAASTAPLLEQDRARLSERLAAAGCSVDALTVDNHARA